MGKKVNQTELALIMGVSDVTLWEWTKAGMPVAALGERGKANEYDTADVIAWKIGVEVGKVQKETPRDALYISQKRLMDIQVAEKEGSLVHADAVEREWSRMVMLARQRLLQLPAAVPLDDATRAMLAAAIADALKELSGYEPGEDSDSPGGPAVGASGAPLGSGLG